MLRHVVDQLDKVVKEGRDQEREAHRRELNQQVAMTELTARVTANEQDIASNGVAVHKLGNKVQVNTSWRELRDSMQTAPHKTLPGAADEKAARTKLWVALAAAATAATSYLTWLMATA